VVGNCSASATSRHRRHALNSMRFRTFAILCGLSLVNGICAVLALTLLVLWSQRPETVSNLAMGGASLLFVSLGAISLAIVRRRRDSALGLMGGTFLMSTVLWCVLESTVL
jgi:hypothetical protein